MLTPKVQFSIILFRDTKKLINNKHDSHEKAHRQLLNTLIEQLVNPICILID